MKKKMTFNKTNGNQIWLVLLLLVSMGLISCNKNGNDPNGNNPNNSGGEEPSVPVVQGDPEGTVTINLINSVTNNNNWYDIGIGHDVHLDVANNFEGVDFVCVGEVESLGHVTTLPNGGWSSSVAAVPENGYFARYNGRYARLFVVDYIISTEGGIMGTTVKYQSPFQIPITLENTSLTFSDEGGTKSVSLLYPTTVTVEEAPYWCTVSTSSNSVSVTVSAIASAQTFSGEIVLSNAVGSVRLSITQQGSTSPKFEGGRGTEQDPYTIRTSEQLANMSFFLSAHYCLISDIDLGSYYGTGAGWIGIGDANNPFSGQFDGQGHTLNEMWGSGLFGSVNNAIIRNLKVKTSTAGVKGGGIVRHCVWKCSVFNCSVTGIVKGMGGIVGGIPESYSGGPIINIERCYVSGSVIGEDNPGVGGICGPIYWQQYPPHIIETITIKECYTEGVIRCNGSPLNTQYSPDPYIPNCYVFGPGTALNIVDCYSTSRLERIINGEETNCWISGTRCYFAGSATTSSSAPTFGCSGNLTYYNSETVGIAGENGRTTAQMRHQSTYEGWDFVNTWRINEGMDYPKLRCFD